MGQGFGRWFILIVIWASAIDLLGQNPTADSVAGYIKNYNTAVSFIDSSKFKEAEVLLKKAIKEKPDYWEAFNKLAYLKIKNEDYKSALKDLDKAEKIAPMNFESLKLRGISLYHLEKYRECKPVLDTAAFVAIEEQHNDAELFYYRALLMFKGKSHKPALESCDMALEFNPKYIPAYVLKGEIRFSMRDYNYAIRELNTAISLMTDLNTDYTAYKLRAKSKFEAADYKGAVSDWNVYIEAIPDEEEALISRGAARININDNTGAISDLDAAIKINGKNPVSYCYRGVAKGGNKSYVEALKDLDYSIKLKFDYPTAYVNRAAIKLASKDKRGACEDLQKADSLGSETAFKFIEKYCKQN